MPAENDGPNKVNHSFGVTRTPVMKCKRLPLQNVPSARKLLEDNYLSRLDQSSDKEFFDVAFSQMDDDTFWKLIDLIEGFGYSINHESDETAEARSMFQARDSAPDNT